MRNGHQNGTDEQQLPTTQSIHSPNTSRDTHQLQHVQNAGHDKLHVDIKTHSFEQTGRVIDQCINSNKLLEEHDTDTDMRTAPTTFLEDISPRGHLQQDRVLGAATLQVWMLFRIHFLVESDLD